MQKKRNQKHTLNGHRALLMCALCLFGFCLLAQKPVQKQTVSRQNDSIAQKQPVPKKQQAKRKDWQKIKDMMNFAKEMTENVKTISK